MTSIIPHISFNSNSKFYTSKSYCPKILSAQNFLSTQNFTFLPRTNINPTRTTSLNNSDIPYEITDITAFALNSWQKLFGKDKRKKVFFEQVFALKMCYGVSKSGALFQDPNFNVNSGEIDVLDPCPRYPLFGICQGGRTDGQEARTKIKDRLTIGWDTEYEGNEDANVILSTQLWFYELGIGVVFIHKQGMRTELSTLFSMCADMLNFRIGKKKAKKLLVTLVAHFDIAEYSSLSDQGKRELLTWDKEAKEWSSDNVAEVIRKSIYTKKPFFLRLRTAHNVGGGRFGISCQLRDTILIQNESLYKLGESIGIKKLDVDDNIEHMQELLKNDIVLFLCYGIRDAHIAAAFWAVYENFCRSHKLRKIPVTSSELAVEMLRKYVPKEDWKDAIGGEVQIVVRNGQRKEVVFYSSFLEPWKRTFHGGRNECYLRDEDHETWTYDYDLCNAYPTAMLRLGRYDVENSPKSYQNWQEELKPDDLGWVEIEFVCEDWVNFPPFAIEVDSHGLIFPSSGRVRTTAVELWSAWQNGFLKSVKVLDSQYYPSLGQNPILPVVTKLIKDRQAVKDSDPTLANLLKLVVNSLYGKFAQGLRKVDMPDSPITNPAYASQITGFIRALVCEQMNFLHKRDMSVISVTTDGYFLQQEIDKTCMSEIEQLPLSNLALEARQKSGVGSSILEEKHRGKGFAALKTRCYLQFEGDKTLVAKGGVKISNDLSNFEKYEELKKVALDGFTIEKLLSRKDEVFKQGRDLVRYERDPKSFNLDMDFKRKLILTQNFKTREVVIYTEPYKSIEEYQQDKKIYEHIYQRTEEVFKRRNVFATIERFEAAYLMINIMRELEQQKVEYKFLTLRVFYVECMLETWDGLPVREVEALTGVSKTTIGKWRNERKIRLDMFSVGLQAEIRSLSLENLPF